MSASYETITTADIIAAAKAAPQNWIKIDIGGGRGAKNVKNLCKYMDITITLADGRVVSPKKIKIGATTLAGSVKPPSERKYGVDLLFRRSSGETGEALFTYATEVRRVVESRAGEIKAKNKTVVSIIQDTLQSGAELDDPMIRVAIAMNMDKTRITTEFSRIDTIGGKPTPVKLNCTPDNIHTFLTAGSIVSGIISMDALVSSGYGLSNPTKAIMLVVKPAPSRVPEVASVLSPAEMAAMASEETTTTEAAPAAAAPGETAEPEPEAPGAADVLTSVDDLTKLRRAAGVDDEI